MRDERRKEGRSKQGQTNNKAKQHSIPKVVTFPKKNELPRVGLEPTTLYMYMYSYIAQMYVIAHKEYSVYRNISSQLHTGRQYLGAVQRA